MDSIHDFFIKDTFMSSNIFICSILGSVFAFSGCTGPTPEDQGKRTEEQTSQKPNILWITCEDMSPRLSCYGDSTILTPTIDKLASEGIRYTNAFSVSGVCAPSRAAIITGLYPTSFGAQHMRTIKRTSALDKISDPELLAIPVYEAVPPPEVKCFSEILRANGYYCTNNSKTDYQFHSPVTAWDECSNNAHWKNRPEGKPFFAVFNIGITHESQVWKMADKPLKVSPEKVPVPPYYPDNAVVRKDIARHYSNILLMDSIVGVYLKEIDDAGLKNNTIVWFYGDHGDGLPRMKRWTYDSGIKVPLIISFPDGQGTGSVDDQLVSFVDFAPTMLSLTGIEIPDYMQGRAFSGPQKSTPRDYIFATRDRMDPATDCRRAVRDKRFKYIKNFQPEKPYVQFLPYRDQMDLMQELLRYNREGKLNEIQKLWFRETKPEEELYDTKNDPHEVKNLANDSKYSEVLARMRKALKEWTEETNDFARLMPEPELIKILWPPDGTQPVTKNPQFEYNKEDNLLTIYSETPGASIAYQNSNSANGNWSLYTGPLAAELNDTIQAVAIRIGYKQSEIKHYIRDGR